MLLTFCNSQPQLQPTFVKCWQWDFEFTCHTCGSSFEDLNWTKNWQPFLEGCHTLSTIIASLPATSTLYLLQGLYNLPAPVIITQPLVLSSYHPTHEVEISCLAYTLHAFILQSTKFSASGLTFTNCNLNYAIISHSSYLGFFDVAFINNTGGGIQILEQSPNVNIINSKFVNSLGHDGGGILASDNAYINLKNSIFLYNNATRSGGAIRLNNFCHLTAKNCTFIDNIAGSGGSVFLNDNSHAAFIDCIFVNNTATDDGGGVFYLDDNSRLHVKNSQFVNNRYLNRRGIWDHNYGGGVMFTDDDTRANFNNCTFFHNRAYFGGGGVLSQDDDSEVKFYNCNFIGNHGVEGGVFYNDDDSKLYLTNCRVERNSCEFTGGVIRGTGDCHITVENSTFMWNGSPFYDSSSFGFFGDLRKDHVTVSITNSIIQAIDSQCPFNFTENDSIILDHVSQTYICSQGCQDWCGEVGNN